MNIITLLAVISIIPQPQKIIEGKETTTNLAIQSGVGMELKPEAYCLKVTPDGILVWAGDPAGRFYAEQTLEQIYVRDEKGVPIACPCVEISDAPRFGWRGIHFDDCRHFFGKVVLKNTLDLMARYKMNVLHWHLTDDQGWRIDIPGHPELVKYGAVRSCSVLPNMKASSGKEVNKEKLDDQKYGPFFYTEADIKEIIAYAAERHIRIVPEIEFPGHVQAFLAAHPEFACEPERVADRDPRVVWGIAKDVLCIGNDEAIRVFEEILDYVAKLFPGDVIHIGGDECPRVRWKTCAKCQSRIKTEGLGDEKGLQPWITRRFVKFLEARGKRVVGWDEYLNGDIPTSAIGMSWRVRSKNGAGHPLVLGSDAAKKGHDVVMTPNVYCYLDYGQDLKEDPFFYIGGHVPVSKCYSLDPCEGVPEEMKHHILGGQGNNWSEYTWNKHDLEWKMWPRACALAEVFWTGETRPGFDDFKVRLAKERVWLISHHVNAAPIE